MINSDINKLKHGGLIIKGKSNCIGVFIILFLICLIGGGVVRYAEGINDIAVVGVSLSNSTSVDDAYHFNMNFTPGFVSGDYYYKLKVSDSNDTEFAYRVSEYKDGKPIVTDEPVAMNKTSDGLLSIDCDLYYDDNTSSMVNRTSTDEYQLTYLTVDNRTIVTKHYSKATNDTSIHNQTSDTLPQPATIGIMIYTKDDYENNGMYTYYINYDIKNDKITDFMKLPNQW